MAFDVQQGQLLRVVVDQVNRLVVDQAQPESASSSALVGLLGIVIVGILVWQRKWISVAGTTVLILVLVTAFYKSETPKYAYHLDVDSSAGTVSWQTLKDGQQITSETLHAADIASSDMAFAAPGGWVQVIGKDGKEYYPLGKVAYQHEPVQFIVVNRIRKMIGEEPATQRPAGSPGS